MVLFDRYVWPGPSAMLFGTFCYAMAERMLFWRSNPNAQCRRKLPRYLAPTEYQMRIRHPPMISWVCIVPLREQILRHYTSNQDFDRIWNDLMAYAVIQVPEISTLLTGVGSGPGYLGVWNIFDIICPNKSMNINQHSRTLDQDGGFPELSKLDSIGLLRIYRMQLPDAQDTCRDAPPQLGSWTPISLRQLFSSPELARKLYYHLELYDSHKSWRIDPALFDKYPLLKFEGFETYTARGTSFRMAPRSMSLPTTRTPEQILHEYQQALFDVNESSPL
jgi:hypothetical protein